MCAPQGSVQGGVQGGAQVPPGVPHSTAPPAGVGGVRRYIHINNINKIKLNSTHLKFRHLYFFSLEFFESRFRVCSFTDNFAVILNLISNFINNFLTLNYIP